MTVSRYRRECVEEAVFALGYLHLESVETLMAFMPLALQQGARVAALHYRAQGEQLSSSDKKTLGLRRAAMMSRQAADNLTARGMRQAIQAHEITLLRATFNERRFQAIAQGVESGADFFVYSPGARGCATCARLRKLRPTVANVDHSQPNDCPYEACSALLAPQIDYRGVSNLRTGMDGNMR